MTRGFVDADGARYAAAPRGAAPGAEVIGFVVAYGCPAERAPPGAEVIGFVEGAPYGCAERVPPGAEVIGFDEDGGAP